MDQDVKQAVKDEFADFAREQIRKSEELKSQALLDYFAGAALVGYMMRCAIVGELIGMEAQAAMSYEYARAMMNARSQRDSTGKVHHE